MAKVKQLHIDIIESQFDSDEHEPELATEPEEEDAEVSTD